MHVFHGVACRMWSYACDAHYVYVHLMEEKALDVCWVWKPIWCVYRKNKGRSKDQ